MGRSDRKADLGRSTSEGSGVGPQTPHDRWLLAQRTGRGVRLLLVAKDGSFRSLLREALESRGHEVRVASDGHEAAAQGQEGRFDVALVLLAAPGAAQILQRLRDLDADLEVVWAP